MGGTLLLAPIPAAAGTATGKAVKAYRQPRPIGITAAMLLADTTDLGDAFRRWLGDRVATKRKAAEYLRLLK